MIDSFKALREQRLKDKEEDQEKLLHLQNGQVSLSPAAEEGPPEKIMGLGLSTWEERFNQPQEISHGSHEQADKREEEEEEHAKLEEKPSAAELEATSSVPTHAVVVRERSRTLDEPSQKTTRAKRESRRMRELEQAKFSLELLKVRTTGGGASSPPEERRWSLELMPSSPPFRSPQGTPDSQSSKGSFELLDLDEEPPKAVEEALDSEDLCSPISESHIEVDSTCQALVDPQSSESPDVDQTKMDLAASSVATHPPKIENYLPTFYVPTSESSTDVSCPEEEPRQKTGAAIFTSTTVTRPLKERRESTRRPVVVVISMQKESPVSQELKDLVPLPVEVQDSAGHVGKLTPSPQKRDPAPALPGPVPTSTSTKMASQIVIEKLVRLNEEKEERQRNQQQQNEKEMMEQIRHQKEVLERQRLFFAQNQREMFDKQQGEVLQRIQQSRHGGTDADAAATGGMAPRPSSLLINKTVGLAPHARTQSDSSPPPSDLQDQKPHPQLPPSPASAPRERRRPVAEGWAPKLTLESRDGAATRVRANRKPANSHVTTVGQTDKPGKIFFSPNDKVTFAK